MSTNPYAATRGTVAASTVTPGARVSNAWWSGATVGTVRAVDADAATVTVLWDGDATPSTHPASHILHTLAHIDNRTA